MEKPKSINYMTFVFDTTKWSDAQHTQMLGRSDCKSVANSNLFDERSQLYKEVSDLRKEIDSYKDEIKRLKWMMTEHD